MSALSPSSTSACPLFDAEQPGSVVAGLHSLLAALRWRLQRPRRLLTGEAALDLAAIEPAKLRRAVAFYWRRDAEAASGVAEAPAAFAALCLEWLRCLGPTFAVDLLQGMLEAGGAEEAEAGGGLRLSSLLDDPVPALLQLRLDLPASLLRLQFACVASVLLASRCHWRCLQAVTLRLRDSGDSADRGSAEVRKKKKHRRDRPREAAEVGLSFPTPDAERWTAAPVDAPFDEAGDAVGEPSVAAYVDVEDDAARLLRESERRHRQRFPFDAEEAKADKGGGDYHARYEALSAEGRQRLLIREDADEVDDSLCTQLALAHEAAVLLSYAAAVAASQSEDCTPRPIAWPEGAEWKRLAGELEDEDPSALSHLLEPSAVSHAAFEPLCALLWTLLSTSPLLLRLLLHRTLPLRLLPALLIARPEMGPLCLPLLPTLLSSRRAAVQRFALYLLACLHVPVRPLSPSQLQERAHCVHLLTRRIAQPLPPQSSASAVDATEDSPAPHDRALLLWARQSVAPLLLLAMRAPKHEAALLSLVRAAKGAQESTGEGLRDSRQARDEGGEAVSAKATAAVGQNGSGAGGSRHSEESDGEEEAHQTERRKRQRREAEEKSALSDVALA